MIRDMNKPFTILVEQWSGRTLVHFGRERMLGIGVYYSEMRHYLVSQTIQVVSKLNPMRLLMAKPSSLNGWLAK